MSELASSRSDTVTTPEVRLPSVAGVWRVRAVVELKEFFRQREALVFTLLFPVILLLVFGAILKYDIGFGVSFTQYFMAGVIAAGILGAGLQNMAISIATERSDGTLKSLVGTPMPKSAYFVGKVVQVVAVTILIEAILLAVGALFYGVSLPTGSDWITFVWVTLLGSAACTLLGIAFSSLAKNGRSASATITPIAIVLQFISGVFFQFSMVPTWLQQIARVFPLRHLVTAMQDVMVRGKGPTSVLPEIGLLLGFAVVLSVIAAWVFKWDDI